MKVVINTRVGGFRLSRQGMEEYLRMKGLHYVVEEPEYGNEPLFRVRGEYISHWDIKRNDPILIKVVEDLGDKAASEFTVLKIVDIPDDVDFIIVDHEDGSEHIAEKHRIWG